MRWPILIGGLGVVDWWHARNGWPTASSQCRAIFRTHHPAGRAIFTAALATGATILHRHITRGG